MSVSAKATYFGRSALQGLRHSPFVHLVAVVTIAIALFATGLARGASRLLDGLVASLAGEVEMTVYLANGLSEVDQRAIVSHLERASGGAAVLLSPSEALSRLSRQLGDLGDALSDLPDNPLPASVELRVPPPMRTSAKLAALAADARGRPGVTGVDYGEQAVARLSAIAAAVKMGGRFAFGVVVLATVIIVAATLQLAIYARRDEIEIQRLVGATDRFVKGPFLLEGLLQGLFGAGLAVLGLWAFSAGAGPHLEPLFSFLLAPGTRVRLVDPASLAQLAAAGCLLGLGGSFIAVGRFLRG